MPVTELTRGDTTFFVIGTAHVSQKSVDEVREVIARVKPQAVCVELDAQRLAALTQDKAFLSLDLAKVIREGRARAVLAQLALTAFQRRLGAKLGVKPGAELRAAIEAADALGVPAELIDRDVRITLGRVWRNLGAVKRAFAVVALVFGGKGGGGVADAEELTEAAVEDLKAPEALGDVLSELGRAVPQVKAPLIDERDAYMASKLSELGAGKQRVVAVVGAAHVPGIAQQLAGADRIDRAALEALPPPPLARRIACWVTPAMFLGLLGYTARDLDRGGVIALMRAWAVPTMIGAGLGALVARAHPLSVLAGAVAAPIAALHPQLSPGQVAGRAQLIFAAPREDDLAALPDALASAGSYVRNRATRALAVTVAASTGAAIGLAVGVVRVALRLL